MIIGNEDHHNISTSDEISLTEIMKKFLQRCIPIRPLSKSVILPSSEIDHIPLVHPDRIINKYRTYCTESRVSTLAQRLAAKSYFGDRILARCTVMGCRSHPALPIVELNRLKEKIFQLFPQHWADPTTFEDTWTSCCTAIGQRCKRLKKTGIHS